MDEQVSQMLPPLGQDGDEPLPSLSHILDDVSDDQS
jgi:hypothetical protein